MQWVLLIATIIILVLYSFYFWELLKGRPRNFEAVLMKQFAFWLMGIGKSREKYACSFYIAALLFEFYILYLAFQVFSPNLFMQFFTIIVIGFELCHYAVLTFNLVQFFEEKIELSQLFNWPLERAAAVFLFTYFLVALIANVVMLLGFESPFLF